MSVSHCCQILLVITVTYYLNLYPTPKIMVFIDILLCIKWNFTYPLSEHPLVQFGEVTSDCTVISLIPRLFFGQSGNETIL